MDRPSRERPEGADSQSLDREVGESVDLVPEGMSYVGSEHDLFFPGRVYHVTVETLGGGEDYKVTLPSKLSRSYAEAVNQDRERQGLDPQYIDFVACGHPDRSATRAKRPGPLGRLGHALIRLAL